MISLSKRLGEYDQAKIDHAVDRDDLESILYDVVQAAREYTSSDHINLTYPDGSCGQRGVVWHHEEQRFVDWGNNIWLYGPESTRGQAAGGKWVIDVRHATSVQCELKKRADHAAKFNRVQTIWRIYWQMLLAEQMEYADDNTIIDLRVRPLNVESLAKREAKTIEEDPDGYQNPNWEEAYKSHDWKNYVSDEVKKIWHTFTPEQRKVLGDQAEDRSAEALDHLVERNLAD